MFVSVQNGVCFLFVDGNLLHVTINHGTLINSVFNYYNSAEFDSYLTRKVKLHKICCGRKAKKEIQFLIFPPNDPNFQ